MCLTFPSSLRWASSVQPSSTSACGFRPVNLIEIDDVSPQPAEAVPALSAYGTCLQRCTDFSVFIPHALALGEHKRTRYSASDSQGDDLFRVTKSVERGRIDPVKTVVQSGLNSGNRIQVALWAHAPVPSAATPGPRTNADRGNVEIAIPS